LEQSVNELMSSYFSSIMGEGVRITFDYAAKNMPHEDDFEKFWGSYEKSHYAMECDYGRSMFGAHLDDFSITFQNKRARVYASRGQQKLLVFLIKLAELGQLSAQGGQGILLLDDFMTDFDHAKVEMCMQALKNSPSQVFVSCPVSPSAFLSGISSSEICHIYLK
jgi:recombinational DNA repair ATPase RecF